MRRQINGKNSTISCFTSSCYQCIKEIQKRESCCINTHSLTVQSINSLMMIKSCCIFIIITEKIFAFVFLISNCLMTYGWNGSSPPKLSPIFRSKQQYKVKFKILIYNLDDDFDELNYSFKFNTPSFREFGNVYNDKYMTPFYYYPIVMV